jgi:hypothetical protein
MCTSKGKKAGHCGKSAHIFVAISYDKGVCFCKQYDKWNGGFFAIFVRKHFKTIFDNSYNPRGNRFFHGDLSQKSKDTRVELDELGVVQFNIPKGILNCTTPNLSNSTRAILESWC